MNKIDYFSGNCVSRAVDQVFKYLKEEQEHDQKMSALDKGLREIFGDEVDNMTMGEICTKLEAMEINPPPPTPGTICKR